MLRSIHGWGIGFWVRLRASPDSSHCLDGPWLPQGPGVPPTELHLGARWHGIPIQALCPSRAWLWGSRHSWLGPSSCTGPWSAGRGQRRSPWAWWQGVGSPWRLCSYGQMWLQAPGGRGELDPCAQAGRCPAGLRPGVLHLPQNLQRPQRKGQVLLVGGAGGLLMPCDCPCGSGGRPWAPILVAEAALGRTVCLTTSAGSGHVCWFTYSWHHWD